MKETSVMCDLCGANDSRYLFSAEGRRFVRCRNCGLVYVNPWIDDYSYESEEHAAAFDVYKARRDEYLRIFNNLLDEVEAHKRTGRLLDVGCGVGQLLEVARARGWDVTGVEPSRAAAEYAGSQAGLNVACGYLTEDAFPPKSFDVITINHALEHMPNPLSILRIARGILDDAGILAVGVPNFGSMMSILMKSKWISLHPEQHRWQFTPVTLAYMLGKAGFGVVGRSFQNHNYMSWKRRLVAPVNWLAMRLDMGDAMLFIAKKS